jgi:hypothetical protein
MCLQSCIGALGFNATFKWYRLLLTQRWWPEPLQVAKKRNYTFLFAGN